MVGSTTTRQVQKNKTESNNVVEWRVEDAEEEDGVLITKATLLLNNKDTGRSFLLDRSKDIHPSIYIGSEGGKVTIDVSGMGSHIQLISVHYMDS